MAITTNFVITKNTVFTTVYDKDSYTVTPSVTGAGGEISPGIIQNVPNGGSCTFTFVPDDGYAIDSVRVNNELVTINNNTYTIENITSNTTIQVLYKSVTLKLIQSGWMTSPHEDNLAAFIRPLPNMFTNDTYIECYLGRTVVAPDSVTSDNTSIATVAIDVAKKKIIITALTTGTFKLTVTHNGAVVVSTVTISKSKLYLDDENLNLYSLRSEKWKTDFSTLPGLACESRTMMLRCVDIGNPIDTDKIYRVLSPTRNRYQKNAPVSIKENYACVDSELETKVGYEETYVLRPEDVNIKIANTSCTYVPSGSDKIYLGWKQRWYSDSPQTAESDKVYNLYYAPLIPGTYSISGTVYGEAFETRKITVSASPVTIDPITVTRDGTSVKPTFRFSNDPAGNISNGLLPYMTSSQYAKPVEIGGKTVNYHFLQTDFNDDLHNSFDNEAYETREGSTIVPNASGYFKDSIAGLTGDTSVVSQYMLLSASNKHIPGTYLSVYPVSIKLADQNDYTVYGALLKITVI